MDDNVDKLSIASDELVGGGPQQRNWRGIGIALLVIITMCALIVLAVVMIPQGDEIDEVTGDPVSLQDITTGQLAGLPTSGVWVSGSSMAWEDEESNIRLVDVSTWPPADRLLQDSAPFGHLKPLHSWIVSTGAQYIAFSHHARKLFRHSANASYIIVPANSTDNSTYVRVTPNGDSSPLIRSFQWSPSQGAVDFVFVYGGDIWYQSDPSATAYRISSGGSELILNGVPDWLYEEEIIGSDSALWWSPSGATIAWARFNDSHVKPIQFPLYYKRKLYPFIKSIPYPKVGEALPTVSLFFHNKAKNRSMEVAPPAQVSAWGDFYLNGAHWSGSWGGPGKEALLVSWSNRWANQTLISACVPEPDQACTSLHQKRHVYAPLGELWASPAETIAAASVPGKKELFTILPEGSASPGPSNAFSHVARVHSGSDTFLKQGDWDVSQILSYQQDDVYFIAAAPKPRNRHVYRTKGSGDMGTSAECITCFMEEEYGCGYISASAPAEATTGRPVFILSCRGPQPPRLFLARVESNGTASLYLLQNNTELFVRLAAKALPKTKFTSVALPGGYEAIVRLLLPPSFNPASTETRYPLLLRVYGGPGSQEVKDTFGLSFDAYMASSHNTIIAQIDARGSGARGWRYRQPIRHHFGGPEIADQIATLRVLAQQNFFIKDTAMGVWGWSYGGFATGHIVEKGGDLFQCGASVAPVTDFRLYDAAYTERYMGSIQSNARGYEETLIPRNFSAYRRLQLLLVHGTGDDNVHFQNSALMVKALAAANVQFRLMIYPNQQHSIAGDRPHLWTLLDGFFKECLGEAS